MLLENGWLSGVKQVPSPHCDSRPDDEPPSLLVVHNISLPPGEFGGPYIDQLFTATLDPDAHPYFAGIHHLRVSAHCLIRRDGEIIQYVPFHLRAWHAGVSAFEGRERCNDFSVGIELEGTDTLPFTTEQYARLVAVTRLLIDAYPITPSRITGHSDIAPGRKTDPGPAFDWDFYYRLLQENRIENAGSIKR
ncbi:1,6-anhydro-N-acetylmuramyl-L-alanine amidase AmpD [Brenneria populi subsp. brevivirga]|uniref:1,6-anhydro-N-acetylmuramyl-L-alanine amidase AmpD n=1 Tax=Brenneria populi TaxID=1505588 RepID=A0ABU6JTM0_9GAMM|nr:1,6-anhydro-N-acetylmuramyl-L-alanine amidase AmpD [Brenneria populi subsp. brevivirga]MEC5343877.1 1,6-anhydro-N-acetylmuramyl-L-alanine amidase AmpD [Brenneria populi Li et al. 2015]